MTRGKFITFEGGEGCGKSTQVKRLVEALNVRGIKAIATREVGGTPSAEEIRAMWLSKPDGYWDNITELCLVMAARREHLVKVIWPAIEEGTWVISDRFVDSSRVYQGVMQKLGTYNVEAVYAQVSRGFWPDLTLLLDLPVDVGMQRVASRTGEVTRFDLQKKDYHERLRMAYKNLAVHEDHRWRIINAENTPEAVEQSILSVLEPLINGCDG